MSGDTLDNNDGLLGDMTYLYPIVAGDWRITPGAGVTWASRNYNQYYYGISAHESGRSGFAQYQPGSSWTPYLELTVNYRFNSNWRGFFSARGMALSSEVKDSPMVSDNYSGLLMTGVSYVF
ncbi:MAG: MltA-interacting protein [Candidatus Erwinia impunctatus]|nr:MltA-interacting protein [Culicoides impunctatus]